MNSMSDHSQPREGGPLRLPSPGQQAHLLPMLCVLPGPQFYTRNVMAGSWKRSCPQSYYTEHNAFQPRFLAQPRPCSSLPETLLQVTAGHGHGQESRSPKTFSGGGNTLPSPSGGPEVPPAGKKGNYLTWGHQLSHAWSWSHPHGAGGRSWGSPNLAFQSC